MGYNIKDAQKDLMDLDQNLFGGYALQPPSLDGCEGERISGFMDSQQKVIQHLAETLSKNCFFVAAEKLGQKNIDVSSRTAEEWIEDAVKQTGGKG